MKHTTKYIALSLAAALACLAVLTACSDDKSESVSQAQSTAPSSSQAASDTSEAAAEQTTVMGEVTYVGSDYISVTAYTGGENVTDFTTLDVSTLTASEETESIDTTDATGYFKVESGMLNAATREDVTTGTFIVSTFDEEGNHQVILVDSAAAADDSTVTVTDAETEAEGETDETASDTSSTSEDSSESAASEA